MLFADTGEPTFVHEPIKEYPLTHYLNLTKNSKMRNYNPLFIYGNSGLGKTHLLNAICYEVKKKFPDMYILYIRAEQFVNEFM